MLRRASTSSADAVNTPAFFLTPDVPERAIISP
jgi:hypothetical protein